MSGLEEFFQSVRALDKHKQTMLDQNLTAAKVRCPRCEKKAALHLRLVPSSRAPGGKALRAWCKPADSDSDGCGFQMTE